MRSGGSGGGAPGTATGGGMASGPLGAIAQTVNNMTANQMFEVVGQLRQIVGNNKDQAKQLLSQNPLLCCEFLRMQERLNMLNGISLPPPKKAPPPVLLQADTPMRDQHAGPAPPGNNMGNNMGGPPPHQMPPQQHPPMQQSGPPPGMQQGPGSGFGHGPGGFGPGAPPGMHPGQMGLQGVRAPILSRSAFSRALACARDAAACPGGGLSGAARCRWAEARWVEGRRRWAEARWVEGRRAACRPTT